MELRKALPCDGIRSLWGLCFPGDDGESFFRGEYDPANTLVYAEGSDIRAMLHILPRSLRLWGRSVPAGYVFGVGTHPDHRGMGLAGDLVEQAIFEMHLRRIPVAFLIPCSEKVLPLYRKYCFAQFSRRFAVPAGPPGVPAAAGDIPALSAMYDAAFPCRAERSAYDWEGILAEYDVGLLPGGYCVRDGRGTLESLPAREDAPQHPLRAMLKVVDAAPLYKLAAGAGIELPACGRSHWCPWDYGLGKESAPPPEEIFFSSEKPYINLLYN